MENGDSRTTAMPIEQRAGTRLDHRFTIPVMGTSARGLRQHGLIDTRQRVYQGGGTVRDFVYWKDRRVSLAFDVWEQIAATSVERLELVDHDRNRCYSIDFEDARRYGRVYDAGIGRRWGVPLEHWRVEQGDSPPRRGEPADGGERFARTRPQLSLDLWGTP